jgi:3-phenylpropionate/cinnamic acid dioxygenase small subunit
MTEPLLDTADRIEIIELMARYGNIIDEREFSRTGEVFTPDAAYDVTDFEFGIVRGVEAIVELWTNTATHPLAHHITNVEIRPNADGTVRVYSKIIAVGHKGRVGSGTYRDIVVKTADGWRIAERLVLLRHGGMIPAIS